MIKEDIKFENSVVFEGMTSIRSIIKGTESKYNDRVIEKILFDKAKLKKISKDVGYLRAVSEKNEFELVESNTEEIEKLTEPEEVKPQTAEEAISQVKMSNITKRHRANGGIIIDGESGCQVKFAKCCNPLPGDKIVGFVTRGFGVSIHKSDCPNVINSRRNEDNLSRWVVAQWDNANEASSNAETYEAMLQIVAEDGIGVIAAISLALADMKVSISQINTQALKNGDMAINIMVGCKNTSHYSAIVSKLRSIPSVISVSRGFSN